MAQRTNSYQKKGVQDSILVVEDNADMWLIIRAALKECFPEVDPVWVSHHQHALIYLAACSQDGPQLPKLIIQDLYLPRREDGLTLLQSIKAHHTYHSIPLCILSQSKDLTDMTTCYQLGAASFVVKPTTYHQWKTTFYAFRDYWWRLVTLPYKVG